MPPVAAVQGTNVRVLLGIPAAAGVLVGFSVMGAVPGSALGVQGIPAVVLGTPVGMLGTEAEVVGFSVKEAVPAVGVRGTPAWVLGIPCWVRRGSGVIDTPPAPDTPTVGGNWAVLGSLAVLSTPAGGSGTPVGMRGIPDIGG